MRKSTFIFLLQLIATVGFSQAEIESQKFSPEALKEDLNFLFTKLESTHPSLYHYTKRKKIDSARSVIIKGLGQPMTRLEFARKIIPIVVMLKDGHTSLSFPRAERTTALKNNGKIFPLDVLIRNNRIFITANYSLDTTLVKYTEILSINGMKTSDLLNQLRPYMSAELEFYRDIRVQNSFRRLLWYVFGFENDYDLELAYDGNPFHRKLTGVTEQQFMEAYTRSGSLIPKSFRYYQLNGDIGVIDFRSMDNKEAFGKFLDSTFTVIQADKIKHLVIDIRHNGGGNSQLGDMLFDYIIDKPYKQILEVQIKQGKKIKQYRGSMKTPDNPANKFTGRTYLLTSHHTFSSANMLASAYKFYNMGTIIGEETGGVLTAFGDLIEITLPNTKLQAWCSHKKFVHPGADGLLHGVKPDVEIIPTQEDIQSGRDAAIEYVQQRVSLND
jgi:hypothetical protein